jgi:hypothetical protein
MRKLIYTTHVPRNVFKEDLTSQPVVIRQYDPWKNESKSILTVLKCQTREEDLSVAKEICKEIDESEKQKFIAWYI